MRSMVEGASASEQICRHSNDSVSRFVDFTNQVACRDTHHPHAVLREPSVSTNVALRPITHVVADAIKFDSQACFRAIEVEHVRSYRMLATENRLSWCAPA